MRVFEALGKAQGTGLVMLATATFVVAPACGGRSFETQIPTQPTATNATVPFPLEETKARIRMALEESEAATRIFGTKWEGADGYADFLSLEDASDALFGERILRAPQNRNDLFVHTYPEALWPSPVYKKKAQGLPFVAAFHVHLETADAQQTSIRIAAVDTQVITGQSWGLGSCGFGYHNDYEPVAPTGVEESRLLEYLVTNLPRFAPPSTSTTAKPAGTLPPPAAAPENSAAPSSSLPAPLPNH